LAVTPDYFAAAGIRLIAGRHFTKRDDFAAHPAAVASEAVARVFGLQPAELIGARLIVPGAQRTNTWAEVVGVVADVRIGGPESHAAPAIYRPLAQVRNVPEDPWLVVQGASPSGPSLAAVRNAIARVDPNLPLYDVRTFAQVRADALADRRFARTMISGYGGASLLLAALGLYAVVAYMVHRRTREFGIRLALGAAPAALRQDVLRSGALLGCAGAVVGAGISLVAARLLWALIPGFGGIELGTVGFVSAGLVVMATLASFLPARRATKVDPLVALRCE
jgi:putative ABC transport system permease protein